MEGLVDRELSGLTRQHRQHVVKALTPGCVTHLQHNRRQQPVVVVAKVETDRIERNPPAARLGQQMNGAARSLAQGLGHHFAHGILQGHAATSPGRQVVGFPPAQRRQARSTEQRGQAQQPFLFVQVQVEHAAAIAEAMEPRRQAPVAHPTVAKAAVHSRSPKLWATSSALTTPSSWKPFAQ
ncbi:hypothetical protein D3C75_866680 [compost metagenome]